jgi:Ca2+-dependent lipid-binding protein
VGKPNQVYLEPDPNSPKKPEMKETAIHKKTRNPIFNEQFQWSVRSKHIDLEQVIPPPPAALFL